ncbi:ankyrin repeat-containing domain protein [Obelidium mucronatum]|nr:ankyrin repeat-containing domain protein [Obelidium mucronatum]
MVKLQELPTEILMLIFVHVHPNWIGPISRSSKLLYFKLFSLWTDYFFAIDNLTKHIATVRWDFLTMIRAKRTINFHTLPLSYHAALLSIYGLSLQSIDHFEVSFDPGTFDYSFVKRGSRILPAVRLAQEHKTMALTEANAYLLSILASISADLILLNSALAFKSADRNTVFSWACAANQIESIEFLLAQNVIPPASSLIVAANYGHLKVVRLLLEPTHSFYTSTLSCALIAACEKNQLETATYLLSCNDIDPSHNKNSALVTACTHGFTRIVALLMATGKCDASDQGNKCILVACAKSYTEIVELILTDDRVDPSINTGAPLISAVEMGNTRIVEALLKTERVNPSIQGNKAIRIACCEGFIDIVRLLLLEPSVNPTAMDCQALVSACRFGRTEIVEILLDWTGPDSWNDNKCDPAAQDQACVIYAAQHGHDRILRLLLNQSSVNPSVKNNLPLFEACSNGHLEVVQLLSSRNLKLEHNVLVRCIEMASKNGHPQILEYLSLNYSTFVSAISPACLLNACQRGHLKVVEFLISTTEFHPQSLMRALTLAATFNHVGVVKSMVEINSQFSFGPAIIKAASLGHYAIVWAILNSSKKVAVPYEAVQVAKDKAIKVMLQSAIGKRSS